MKKLAILLALLLLPVFALGQTGAYSGHSFVGGTPATTSGMNSSNYLNGIIPGASITVYLTGTTTKATIYADGSNTPLSNPFFSNLTSGTNPGGFIFWAAQNQGLDIQAQGGMGNASCTTSPLCYSTATMLQVDVYPNNSFSLLPLNCTGTGSSQVCTFAGTVAAGGVSCPSGAPSGSVCSNGVAVTPSTPLASSLGLTVDGSDQSANFMTLANKYQIAGVPLAFVVDANGSCLNLSTIGTLPNDGNATHPRQIPIHISGAAYQVDGSYANPTVTGSCLEVGSTGVAGIDTRGFGQLELDHLIIKQTGSGSAPIIQTTNTNLRPHDVYLWGTGCQWNARNAGIMLGSSDINNTTSPGLGATGAYWAYGSSGNNIIFHCVNQAIWSRTGANASLWTSLVVDAQSGDNTTLAQVQGAQASATAYSYSSNLLTLTATNSYAAGTYVQVRNSSGDALHALSGKIYQISATGLSGSQIEIPTAAITGSGSTTTTLIGVTTIPVANTTYSASAGTLTLTGTNIYAAGNTITFQPPPYVHNTTWTSTGSSVTINATNSYTTSSAITFQDSPGDPLYALACTSGAIGSSTCPSFTPTATSGTSYTIPTSLIAAGSGSTISTAYSDPLVPLFCWGGYVGSATCPSFTVQAGPTNSSYNILTTLVTGSGSTSATSQDVGYKAPFSFTGWTPGGTQIGPGYVETTYYADAGVLISGSSPNNTFPGMAYYDPKATCGLGGCLSGGNYYPGTLNYIHIAQAASGGYTNDSTFSGQYFGGAPAVSLIQNDISTSESYNIQAGQSIYGDLTFLGYNMNHTPLHVPPNADASNTTGEFWNRSAVDPVNPGCNYGVMRYGGRFGMTSCSTTTPYIFVTNTLNGGGTTYYYDALIQTTLGGLSVTAPSATQSTNYFTFNYGTLKVPYSKSASGYNCLQIDSNGVITNTGAACGGGASVTSLNTLTGSVNVTAGAGVNVAVSGQNIQVSAPGNGADLGSGLLERSMIESTGSPYFCCGTGGYTHEGTTAAIANATSSMPAMLNSTSTAGANDLAGWAAQNQGIYYTSQTPNVLIPIGFPSSADYGSTNSERILIGVAYLAGGGCTVATLMASDAPTCDFAAVRYSNVAGDTTFMCAVDDAGSVTTAAITGVAPTAGYPIYVWVMPTGSSTACTVKINGIGYSATVTATLPNAPLGAFFMNQAETSTAVHIMAQGVLGTN